MAPVAAAAAAEAAEDARFAALMCTCALDVWWEGHMCGAAAVAAAAAAVDALGELAVRVQSLFRGHRVRRAASDWHALRAQISLHRLQQRWDDARDAAVAAEAAAAAHGQGRAAPQALEGALEGCVARRVRQMYAESWQR